MLLLFLDDLDDFVDARELDLLRFEVVVAWLGFEDEFFPRESERETMAVDGIDVGNPFISDMLINGFEGIREALELERFKLLLFDRER